MKHIKRALLCATTAAALLIPALPATAAPAPGYEEFDDCPSRSVDSEITACFISTVDGGNLKLGSKNTPIVDPIKLAGAVTPAGGIGGTFVVGSFDGGRQPVPGGMVGLTGLDWLIYLLPNSLLGLYAEAELAGTPSGPIGDPFVLPLKVKLENPLLSDNCYIGSDSNPIMLRLTRGTTAPPPPNTPISGFPGNFSADPLLPGVLRITDSILVDNAFAAPVAQGCDFLPVGVIDALVNAQAGLPSAAGTNTAVQEADAALGDVEAVYPPGGIE